MNDTRYQDMEAEYNDLARQLQCARGELRKARLKIQALEKRIAGYIHAEEAAMHATYTHPTNAESIRKEDDE